MRRIFDGICSPIPPSEMRDWAELTGETVHEYEWGILRAMDREYASKMNEELQAFQARKQAEQAATAEANKPKGRRR